MTDDDPLALMAELLRLRANAGEPLTIAEMLDLADALATYGHSVNTALNRISTALAPKGEPVQMPLFAIIPGGKS